MISIIVPVYNAKHTIEKCVDSILDQKYSDFELLLVDDGSTDGSHEICDALSRKDSRVRTFHQANQGVSAARNVGLDNAKGEYITFADADDYVEPTWLSDFIDVAGEADVIFQNAIWHYPDGRLFLRSVDVDKNLSYKEQLASLYPRSFLGYVWATLFKRSIIQEGNIRFNPLFSCKEDLDFVLNYCKYASSLLVLPCRNYHYIFPEAGSRDYDKPNVMRLVLEIQEKKNVCAILGQGLAKSVTSDIAIKAELLNIYMSNLDVQTKQRALSIVYEMRPLDKLGGAKLALMALLVNILPKSITHKLFMILF